MDDRFQELTSKLDKFEPGGFGERVALGLIEGVIALAEILEQIRWDTQNAENLSAKIDGLNEKLDGFVRVLSSAVLSEPPDDA